MSVENNHTTKAGTVGGTVLTILVNIGREDIVKTAVLAGIGAVVSFMVTLVLKKIIQYFGK
ncbi:MAG: hypothetical protein KGO81_06055 [Bacteroidota bacterium]|nr:hypothetical protein [Bacteroidota bacterium]